MSISTPPFEKEVKPGRYCIVQALGSSLHTKRGHHYAIYDFKADKNSEAGILPDEKLLAEMGKHNEDLAKAGVLLAAEGLQPSSKGARVKFAGNERTITEGPFAQTKELIAGFWLWQVKSEDEVIEWVKRCPNPFPGKSEIEIRQLFEAEDFGADFTPELREREERVRAQVSRK